MSTKKAQRLKVYEVYHNGTHQANVMAYSIREARNKVLAWYGEHREVYYSSNQ